MGNLKKRLTIIYLFLIFVARTFRVICLGSVGINIISSLTLFYKLTSEVAMAIKKKSIRRVSITRISSLKKKQLSVDGKLDKLFVKRDDIKSKLSKLDEDSYFVKQRNLLRSNLIEIEDEIEILSRDSESYWTQLTEARNKNKQIRLDRLDK